MPAPEGHHPDGAARIDRPSPERIRGMPAMPAKRNHPEGHAPKAPLHRRLTDDGPPRAVEARARDLTVMFTDLGGSTALYARLGDRDAFALVRRHFAGLRAGVLGAGGTVVKDHRRRRDGGLPRARGRRPDGGRGAT